MTDKELLELAAKAAGVEYPNGQTYCETLGVWGMLDNRPYSWWNPLTDDGDALQLAVKLYKYDAFKITDIFDAQFGEYDPYSATRRAIVRAAAAIGEMK
jgi:hypothetical protein